MTFQVLPHDRPGTGIIGKEDNLRQPEILSRLLIRILDK